MFSAPSNTADLSSAGVEHRYDPVVPLYQSAPWQNSADNSYNYAAVSSVPGGLAKALQVLQDRFGQPFKMVRACVDTLVKGPAIAPQDKKGLRCYADTAQVMYDTLEAMNCLGEMNTDNLEKMILRLPK